MKPIYTILLALSIFLSSERFPLAKTCDEVLYVAYSGGLMIRKEEQPIIPHIESIPYYFGAICIDNKEKELSFFPRKEAHPLNEKAQSAIRGVNDKERGILYLKLKDEYTTKGEGLVRGRASFIAPLNTPLFSYWAREYVQQEVGTIVRRDINAEPETDWNPHFTDARPFTKFLVGEMEGWPKSYNWTDDKGRSGP